MSRIAPPVLEYAQARRAGAMCGPVGALAALWGLFRLMLGLNMLWHLWPRDTYASGDPFLLGSMIVSALGGFLSGPVLIVAGLMLLARHRFGQVLLLAYAGLTIISIGFAQYALFCAYGEVIRYQISVGILDWLLPAGLALLAGCSRRLHEECAGAASPLANPMLGPLSAIGSIWGSVLVLAYGWGLIQIVFDLCFAPPNRGGFLDASAIGPTGLVCLLGGLLLALPLSVLLLVDSWRLTRSPKAPGLLVRWAIAWLIVQVAHGVLLYGYVLPQMPKMLQWFIPDEFWPASISVVGGGVFGVFLNVALPVLVLVYCRKGAAPVEDRAC